MAKDKLQKRIPDKSSKAVTNFDKKDLQPQNLWLQRGALIVLVCGVCLAMRSWPNITMQVKPIERIAAEDVTGNLFHQTYANQRPVVVTGAWPQDGWRLAEVQSKCPTSRVRTFRYDHASKEWGGHTQVGVEKLSDYYATQFNSEPSQRPDPPLYGFEVCLKEECPILLETMMIPSYLTEDAFHLMTNSTGMGWPTMLLGPKGSQTGLHIDTHRLPFWIAIVGAPDRPLKRVRIWPHDDQGLYEYIPATRCGSIHTWDPWHPDLKLYPKVADSFVYEAELHSGDLLYIPGGSPHAVVNLEDNLGISMNYLDLASFQNFTNNCKRLKRGDLFCSRTVGKERLVVTALRERQRINRTMNYFEFAGVQNRKGMCQAMKTSAWYQSIRSPPWPVLEAYCKTHG
eukprot:TRINITY_DN63312_c0_g1_i1.p1 TRINITY_DN63312_c0_g1~~TRINITY_DN63312_c0_g1_i1.p1  ORF type:complete len:399 (-),score=38.92 TRINITY_DN63312_c0_g1_i1:89-1285(-)